MKVKSILVPRHLSFTLVAMLSLFNYLIKNTRRLGCAIYGIACRKKRS